MTEPRSREERQIGCAHIPESPLDDRKFVHGSSLVVRVGRLLQDVQRTTHERASLLEIARTETMLSTAEFLERRYDLGLAWVANPRLVSATVANLVGNGRLRTLPSWLRNVTP